MRALYPLRFHPVYKDYVWGGDKIITHFKRHPAGLLRYAESWEVSDRPEGMSVVADGPLAGKSLRELSETYGAALMGTATASGSFPLLIKLIDARDALSVQVHPDDSAAARYSGQAKSEMWYVLQADPGTVIYCGFDRDVRQVEFETALREKNVADLLRKIPVKAGDTIYVPGGCVHAIGAGCLLLEIQQSSDTTYRIYDWDRPGPDGKPRELHIQEALKVIRWDLKPQEKSPYFHFETRAVNGASKRALDGRTFEILFVESGRILVEGVELNAGDSALIPASLSAYTMDGEARVCVISLP